MAGLPGLCQDPAVLHVETEREFYLAIAPIQYPYMAENVAKENQEWKKSAQGNLVLVSMFTKYQSFFSIVSISLGPWRLERVVFVNTI